MSDINFSSIDETFPIAGQDNDSQGFRDNFAYIKNGLGTAKSEISSLELNAAKLNVANDFNGTLIQNAALLENTYYTYGIDNVQSTIDVSYTNGHYQLIQCGADITLRLANWPTSTTADKRTGFLRIIVTGDSNPGAVNPTARSITFVTTGGGILRRHTDFTNPFTITYNHIAKIFDFWSTDGGSIIYGHYVGEFAA